MEFEELEQKLLDRAKAALLNGNEIDEMSVFISLSEALEEANGADVPSYVILDIAMFRLKNYLKITPNKSDTFLYEQGVEKIKKAPRVDIDNPYLFGVENRGDVWI